MSDPLPTPASLPNRWLIAIMGTVLQIGLGTVYAWSFFQNPMKAHFGLDTDSAIAWIFCLAICFLGLSAAVGGVLLPKWGPLKLALAGAILYPIGWLLGSYGLTIKNLPLIYLGFGVIGGCGLGLGYVTPVATAAKWFPDRKGMVTGMVLMGFGFGALAMSKLIGPALMASCDGDLSKVFLYSGAIIAAICLPAACFMRNPPAGYVPAGYAPSATAHAANAGHADLATGDCLLSGRFAMMWAIFFCNITAGIMFIAFQSPMLQELLKKAGSELDAKGLAAAGGTLIGISSIFNGVGRMFWGWVADKLGRIQAFRIILGSQVVVFVVLMLVPNPWVFGFLVCYIMLCYGGGFGTMPSFVLDTFGGKLMPVLYGTVLTAWSMAGIAGPQLVSWFKTMPKDQQGMMIYGTGASMLALGLIISFFLSNKPFAKAS